MDQFWAKSNQETIVEHTNNLLKNYTLLKKLYPSIPVTWPLLELACKYHDLGKMNHLFQAKIRDGSMKKNGEIPHGLLSIHLIPAKELKKNYPLTDVQALVHAVALHHERDFSEIDQDDYQKEIDELNKPNQIFPYSILNLPKPKNIKPLSNRYYELGIPITSRDPAFHAYVMLKGLLNKIDYAASGYFEVEYPADFLEENLQRMPQKWREASGDPTVDWNSMQKFAYEHQNENLLVLGQTGLGKTEAGLLWIGNHKGFFTLPLQAAINAIYQRIKIDIADPAEITQQVAILHSNSFAVLLSEQEEFSSEDFESIGNYLNNARNWSLPLTITTLDQTFDFVYHYRGFEAKLATFSYAKIVIDEIQMYSPDLLAYLIKGLKEIQEYGGKFMIMTATMPEYLIDLFHKNNVQFTFNKKPFLDEKLLRRHFVCTIPAQLEVEDILAKFQNQKVLVICNTISKAKELYNGLHERLPDDVSLNLLHSQFTRKDRQKKEKAILEFAKSDDVGIWVATQVVEASLDIDFDLLLTELSELNSLFQRMGRCYRKRSLRDDATPNVFVYTGDESPTSGIGISDKAVVQEEIFMLAKNALGDFEGIMDESKKMTMIATAYSTDKMQETKYYKQIVNMLNWLNSIENDQKSKQEVQRLFRNINMREVIPEGVYRENKTDIEQLINILQTSSQGMENYERKKIQEAKKIAKVRLESYMLAVQEYIFVTARKNGQIRSVELNRYNTVEFIEGKYTSESGFYPAKKTNFEDNLF